jgi:hypothetical protein
MVRLLALVLELVERLLDYLKQREDKAEQAKAQAERDVIARDPAEWLESHFGGMPAASEGDKDTSTTPTETNH